MVKFWVGLLAALIVVLGAMQVNWSSNTPRSKVVPVAVNWSSGQPTPTPTGSGSG